MSCTKFYLSEETVKKLGIPVGEALMLLSVYFDDPIGQSTIRELRNKGLLDYQNLDYNSDPQGIELKQEGVDLIETIFINSELGEEKIEDIEELAKKLQEIFPSGKKSGTNYYFRGNLREVVHKLKKFFKMYPHVTYEQVLTAAKTYVESFNGDYSYMRILPYFILKFVTKVGSDGASYREEVSDLATYIENAGQEDMLGNDWTSTLM